MGLLFYSAVAWVIGKIAHVAPPPVSVVKERDKRIDV